MTNPMPLNLYARLPTFTPDRRYPMSYLPPLAVSVLPPLLRTAPLAPSSPPGLAAEASPPSGCILGAKSPRLRAALTFMLIGTLVFASDAMAMKTDGLKIGLTALEAVLTGNLTRLIVICGSLWGAYQAYVASKPMLLGGSLVIGLGLTFLMTWANETWAMLI